MLEVGVCGMLSVNRKRHNFVVPVTPSCARYQDMKALDLSWTSERLLGMVTSFLIGVAWARGGSTAHRFGASCCTDRGVLAFSPIRSCGGENLMTTTPHERKEARHPKSPSLEHVTWWAAV